MRRSAVPAWWLFALCALVPAALVAVLAWRARSAVVRDAREAEQGRTAQAANEAKRELEARLSTARRLLSSLPEGGDALAAAPPGMTAFVLDAGGKLVVPAPPEPAPEASSSCVAARGQLLGSSRAAARETIVKSCRTLRSETGRLLWPLLALEDAETARDVPAWLEREGQQLAETERSTLRSRLEVLEPTQKAEALRILARPANEAVALAARLVRRDPEVSEGALRVRTGAYVAILRTLSDRRTAGLVLDGRSVLASPPALPADLAIATGEAKTASFALGPELAFHVVAKDPSSAERRAALSGNVVLALSGLGAALSIAFAAILYARFLRARDLAQLRTDFVAAVSHELHTPAGTVLMLSELLEQGAVPDDERREVETSLVREARRLSATLTRMLRFGALRSGKLTATIAKTRIGAVVGAAVERFERAHPSLAVAIEGDMDFEADLDAELVGLALDNLLGNAAKYAPEGAPYRIRAEREADALVIAVTDRGPGLSREAAARVFLPWERADARLSRATEGTGIGLALVRAIAEAHGGTARVESVPGEGSTFMIEVPWKRS